MSAASIVESWKKKNFKPIYWLEGEEDFFIDEIVNYAEKQLLPESEASFNLTVFYGKDANWPDVVNACRRYPMFAERQVVVLKEAQQMKDIDKLEPYISNPSSTTIFVVAYKGKNYDQRSKLAKSLKETGEVFRTKKIYENQIPAWTTGYLTSRGYSITPKALHLMIMNIGNDLSRIANECEKIALNVSKERPISEDDIELYIGISKKYNIFELQAAIGARNIAQAVQVIQFFEGNPDAAKPVMILPTLYAYFSKMLEIHQMPDKSEYALKPAFAYNPVAIKQGMTTLQNYSFDQVEKVILILHEYNLKSIGINNYKTSIYSLLRELVYKIIYC